MENKTTPKATDFLVDCMNPSAFEKVISQLGPAVLVEDGGAGKYLMKDGHYVMRVMGDPGFVKFAIKNQGYGTIVEELTEIL
jgi:hypothetical protein